IRSGSGCDVWDLSYRWRATHGDLADECDALIRTRDPDALATTLVHGDYFRSNLIAADGDVHVVDWDLLALGDPMWDLAFLVSAEPDVPPGDVEGHHRRLSHAPQGR
ncbi:MAG: phosphotransferase, partial [Gammaproteobacteria bacterium]